MSRDDYYTRHWREIEDERFARYEQMFVWREDMAALFEPADVKAGHTVLDFGCGPGYVAIEMARRVGATGHVHGVDLNERFIDSATSRAQVAGVADRISFHHVTDGRPPLADASVDRVICKNVLEYVPDAPAQIAELMRVLRPGGKIHLLDSDWAFVVVQPWEPDVVREFFAAAAPAFREPYIGRKLPGLLTDAGFEQIRVRIMAGADREGRLLPVLRNMASYAREFGTLPDERLDDLLSGAEAAIGRGHFLAILPQFVVTATAPE